MIRSYATCFWTVLAGWWAVTSGLAQPVCPPFQFSLPDSARSSAGVFAADGTLLRTLWSGVALGPGTHTRRWDGTDDEGRLLPPGSYTLKVLTNTVTYTWEGVVGNTSDTKSGPTYLNALENIACMTVVGNTAYYGTHYNEQKTSCFALNTAAPQAKRDILNKGAMVWLVASDGTNVYWGGADPNRKSVSFVFATCVADDAEASFSSGVSLKTTHGRVYSSALSVIDNINATPTGLAVQRTGTFLFVSRQRMNTVYVLNKLTGVPVGTLPIASPRELAVDRADNVWLISGQQTVQRYVVQPNGTLQPDGTPLTGLVDPLALGVSPDGNTLIVCDGGTSQQLKAYDPRTGQPLWTFGQAGGYATDPTVTPNKFYFSDSRGARYPLTPADVKFISTFVTFSPDGSFWVGDTGNNRVVHYAPDRTYLNQVMYTTGSLNCSVDANNPSRVFSDFMEFKVDYSKPLSPTNGSWTLVRNWSAMVPPAYDVNVFIGRFRNVATLRNGRTYALLTTTVANRNTFEVVELPTAGPLRYTGVRLPDATYQLYPDGSLRTQSIAELGKPIRWQYRPLLGFDTQNDPLWAPLQPLAQSPPLTTADPGYRGNPASLTSGELTSTSVVVAFDGGRKPLGKGAWFHLGGVRAGTDAWLWRTAPSSTSQYSGDYPTDGVFDIGNGVNNAGSRALAMGRHILWGYYGEFWKGTQTNKWQHVYDNGLFVGQFGPTGRDGALYNLIPGMTGNAFSAHVTPSPLDPNVAYLYHNDDGWHCGVHRWRISGLNTIREQSIPVTLTTDLRGLRADFMDGRDLDPAAIRTTRIDPTPSANWPNGPTNTTLADPTNYSVRWQGFVIPPTAGTYTFSVSSNNKSRLWLDNTLLIDRWASGSGTAEATLALEAGKGYPIRLEYAPPGRAAVVNLQWSGPGLAKQPIPTAQLVPAAPTSVADGIDLLTYLTPGTVLEHGLYGWQRNAANEDYTDPYRQWWSARTGFKSYGRDRLTSSDLWVKFIKQSGTGVVQRSLPRRVNSTRWRLTGRIYYDGEDGNKPGGSTGFVDVLDEQVKVIVRLHLVNTYPTMTLFLNNRQVAQLPRNTLTDLLYRAQPIDIQVNNRQVRIQYGPFPAITTPPVDSTANWKQPRSLRLLCTGGADGSGHAFGVEQLLFFSDDLTDPLPLLENKLLVYPNPAQDEVTVLHPLASEPGYVDLYAITGQRLLRQLVDRGTGTTTFTLTGYNQHIYIIRYVSGNQALTTRLMKQ